MKVNLIHYRNLGSGIVPRGFGGIVDGLVLGSIGAGWSIDVGGIIGICGKDG